MSLAYTDEINARKTQLLGCAGAENSTKVELNHIRVLNTQMTLRIGI